MVFLCRFDTAILAASFTNHEQRKGGNRPHVRTNHDSQEKGKPRNRVPHRGIVRVGGGHGRGGLGCELVELAGGDALVDPQADLLRDEHGVAVVLAEAVAELLEARRDLVEVHRLLPPVPLHHVHVAFGPPAGEEVPSNSWCARPRQPPPPSSEFEGTGERPAMGEERAGSGAET